MQILGNLYAKLALGLLALLLLVSLLYGGITLLTTRLYLQEINQKLNRDLAQHLVAENLLGPGGSVNKVALENIFHMMMVINPSIELYLLDRQGNILAFSAPPGKVKQQHVSLLPIRRLLKTGATLPVLGDDPRQPGQQKIFSASPIPQNGPVQGYVYIVLAGEAVGSVTQMLEGSYILRSSAAYIGGAFVAALVAGLILLQVLTRRLSRLRNAVLRFQGSNPHEAIHALPVFNSSNPDEIDCLSMSFHSMAERIAEQMHKLQETDKLRRELVANVSHDLRTPLAALQGYLDTLLLKEGKLSAGETRQYLEIASKHSERLGKLVAELFELAKLDSQETPPQIETFCIAELVQDVMHKFQLMAQQKQLTLHSERQTGNTFVLADIALIERVLQNLLENAIRYTPASGSITLSLHVEQGMVWLQVADTGCGIPGEELPYIFDRFHRAKQQRGDGGWGLGIGLAMAKRILELHNSDIHADSVLDQGTRFRFCLPMAHGS